MPRTVRNAPGGVVFHVLNRANGRLPIFAQPGDYDAFERVMQRTMELVSIRLVAYALMPNHWHLVLWPFADGDLAAFMHRLTTTHVRRWHLHRHSVGTGHLYQGTFKSFPVQTDEHLLTVCRYVERNPLRAGLVERAQDWPWSSCSSRRESTAAPAPITVSEWPIHRPANWPAVVNAPMTAAELDAVRLSVARGRPFGSRTWQAAIASALGIESTLHPRGRPRQG